MKTPKVMNALVSLLVCLNRQAGAGLAAVFLLLAGSVLANTVTVTSLADSGAGSLRDAISATAANGTINFQTGLTGTITLTSGELAIARNLTITGPGAAILAISGNNSSRVFNINSVNASLNISGLTITGGGNYAGPGGDALGGGIMNLGTLALTECTVISNTATATDLSNLGQGGGIYSSGNLTLTRCAIMGNSAVGGTIFDEDVIPGASYGGGICIAGTSAFLVNCTIASNLVSGSLGKSSGGGIYLGGSQAAIESCTISRNVAQGAENYDDDLVNASAYGGGICISNGAGQFEIENSIVSGNSILILEYGYDPNPVFAEGPDVFGSIDSLGFNLIGETDDSSGWIGNDLTGTSASPLDPQLGPLQNNGGQTPTMAPAISSAAVDAGYSLGVATDQRGSRRPFVFSSTPLPLVGDGSDIGAYELLPAGPRLITQFHSPFLNLQWAEGALAGGGQITGGGVHASLPVFGLQTLQVGGSFGPGEWTTFASPVRYVDDQLVARDSIASVAGTIYRLNSGVTNMVVLPPAATAPATAITSTGATLNGTTTPYGFNTSYWFQYGPDTNYGTSTMTNTSLTASTNPASLSCAISGLNPMTTCHFQLVVKDDDGTQLGGDQPFTTLGLPPTLVTLAASSIGATTATLNGTVNGNGSAIAGYFQYDVGSSGTTYNYSTSGSQFYTSGNYYSPQEFSTTIDGLMPNTTYHYRIIAFGASEGFGADTSFTTAAGGQLPTALTDGYTNVFLIGGYIYSAQFRAMVNPNGADTKVCFAYGTSTDRLTNTTPMYDIGSGTAPINYNFTVTNLNELAASIWYFSIIASNSIGVANEDILYVPLP